MRTTPLSLIVAGTDTGVGKTHVLRLLAMGLRTLDRRVWVHKPVACGDWDGATADDGRTVAALVGDGQDPATAAPRQWPEACSPHLAARLAGERVATDDLVATARALLGEHDLLIEGAGGLLSPLATDGGTLVDLAQELALPLLVVTRPHLGTLNHTALTVRVARAAGLHCLGLVVNHHEPVPPSVAVATAGEELSAIAGLPVLSELAYGHAVASGAQALAGQVVAAHAEALG